MMKQIGTEGAPTLGYRLRSAMAPAGAMLGLPYMSGALQRVFGAAGEASTPYEGSSYEAVRDRMADLMKGTQDIAEAGKKAKDVVEEIEQTVGPTGAGYIRQNIMPEVTRAVTPHMRRLGIGTATGLTTYLLSNALLRGMVPPAPAGKMVEDRALTPTELDEYFRARSRRNAIRQAIAGTLGLGAGYGTYLGQYPEVRGAVMDWLREKIPALRPGE